MKVSIITANTKVYKGEEENKSGNLLKEIFEKAGHEVVFMKAVPTDHKVLATVFERLADGQVSDLILTTGGAGSAPEDCAPEATLGVAEKLMPGIPEAIRTYMMTLTKRTMLNRGVAVIRKKTLIVNLPGKAAAVKACMDYIMPELTHAVHVIKGEA